MLTPEQVKTQRFRSAGKGLYRSEDVDAYMNMVARAFEDAHGNIAELQKNNDEFYLRVEALANALNQMRAEREFAQKEIQRKQMAADELTARTQEESARLLREAREEADGFTTGARQEVDKLLLEAQAHAENILARGKARAESLFEEARDKAQQELLRIAAETKRERQELARLRWELPPSAQLIRERAEAGDPEFQWRVGQCYYIGDRKARNIGEAIGWYRLAAEQGHAAAQNRLGFLFQHGEGVGEDPGEAIKWYKLAAAQGHAAAQDNLAACYRDGIGVAQDYKEALRLFHLSAEQGHMWAYDSLGGMYFYGKGVEQDLEKAKQYYEMAGTGMDLGSEDRANDKMLFETFIQPNIDRVVAAMAAKERDERIAARKEVFISYAHKDAKYKEELCQHLNASKIVWWADTRIEPGDDWDQSITDAIARMRVAVLLVSVDFITSEYIQNTELPQILAAEAEGAKVLWLPVRPCMHKVIARYQAFTDPKRPLAKRDDAEREEVYTDLAEEILKILDTQPDGGIA